MGGSYYLESLTNAMETAAYDYFRRIEDVGGVLPALESGFFQREIADAAYVYQREEDRKERITVGVNEYTTDEALTIPLLRVDAEGAARHIHNLNELRRRRDNRAVAARLRDLARAAQGTDNLMPPLLAAVRAYATLGEMMGVFRDAFGEYRPGWGF